MSGGQTYLPILFASPHSAG
ncbi:hypothetical protein E2C01_101800 [Portunus trituberculatus]|uniref:Uncharacterized protein n=1 Tax=Portunus trituberculatus TaxID=210409 RepID=A0A5B7KAQ6_PORTR|nr:hypothetical protein [Portunus trituberculatus]